MPTYAPVPAFAERKRYPRALILIVAGHAAVIATVMMARMDLPSQILPTVTNVELVPLPKDPPPVPPEPRTLPEPSQSVIDKPVAIIPVPSDSAPVIDSSPVPVPQPGPIVGPALKPAPDFPPTLPAITRTGPRFATPDSQLRPPYPPAKVRSGEEASLRLRLAIDARGRVTAVDPVGSADPAFLASARRHLIARWRYQPATENGKAIASTTIITLQFKLD